MTPTPNALRISAAMLTILLIYSCSKFAVSPEALREGTFSKTQAVQVLSAGGYCYYCGIIDNMPAGDQGVDSVERPTILGMQHVNPYLLPNIQQAYNNLHVSITATVTNLYVEISASQYDTARCPGFDHGTGVSSGSGLIALGEAWAYHMGFYLCNKKYNDPVPPKGDQNIQVQPGGTSGYDLVALEAFNPTLGSDPFKWIPTGLMLDLIDSGTEPSFDLVNDAVSGYTISQIFNALQSDVSSPLLYRAKLLQLYGTAQQAQVNSLFASYGY